MLTANDLESNPVLIRKIKRIQAAENAQDEESDGDEGSNRRFGHGSQRQEVTSSPAPTLWTIKRERISQAGPVKANREISMVPSTQIQEIDDGEMDSLGNPAHGHILELQGEAEDG